MISQINIKNFKALENVEVACKPLNIFSGVNGAGKSSLIHSLLLLKQSYDKGFLGEEGLFLNGDLVDIGTGKDALFFAADDEEIRFELDVLKKDEKKKYTWSFTYATKEGEEDEKFPLANFLKYASEVPKYEDLHDLALFGKKTFRYLNADRLVANEYPTSDFDVLFRRNLGKNGQFTAHFLDYYGNSFKVDPLLMHSNETAEYLKPQLDAWLGEICPGIKMSINSVPGTNTSMIRYGLESSTGALQDVKPLNMGFGVTYIVSILTAILSSQAGDILIIENPESHIHPMGQSILSRLLCRLVKLGTQVFIETHSDHIINGILVSIYKTSKGEEDLLTNDDISVYFIERPYGGISSEVHSVEISSNGRVKGGPDGFFDQFTKDLKELVGF
ncbi:MAG: DUF3696 domain-containing protein [Sphingobacterium sp.]|jgi:predicted ATPase|nr:DUF3696 domain-containing protein [Sphingobacterium sp.]